MKTSVKTFNKKRREIVDFARDNNLIINPGVGYDYYVESYFKFACCPCDTERKNCPCSEAKDEVNEIGWCKCRLFWRDLNTFKESHVPEVN